MVDLPLKRLRQGMIVAQSVYNSSGASYLSKGMSLTAKYIEKLRQLGVGGIHVVSTTPGEGLVPPDDVLRDETRAMAVKRVYDVFSQITQKGTFDPEPLTKASSTIVNDIIERKNNLVQLTDLRAHDMYTFAHSVNVAMLSALLANLLGYSKEKISELTLGALLHDLGKTAVPTDILNKPSRLTDQEFGVIKNHPAVGSEKILGMKIPNAETIAIVARQHHEKMDGSGYPDKRQGKNIHPYGRIAAIADVYDALTSERPYKKGYAPSVAHHIMANCSPGHFDEEYLRLFFQNVAIYPVGTVVSTSLGYGIVRRTEFGKTDNPVVCVFANKDRKVLKKPLDIDFSSDEKFVVNSAINDKELLHFIQDLGFDPASLLVDKK